MTQKSPPLAPETPGHTAKTIGQRLAVACVMGMVHFIRGLSTLLSGDILNKDTMSWLRRRPTA
ncbi:MAG TPA: hypothetical protein VHP58_03115 [Alphaproteobacteria bacterium]|nr:hypothetical protein [Alphaproteobacteria bacterium]